MIQYGQIPTPAIRINLETVRNNILRAADYTKSHSLQLRPHTKTHKSLLMAQLQIESGASGLTVAKVGEAEVMAAVHDNFLIAYPAVDPHRCQHIANLAKANTIQVAVDSVVAVESLARAVQSNQCSLKLLVDIDVGHHRTGAQSAQQALQLAQTIDQTQGIELEGLFFFPGHLSIPPGEQDQPLQKIADYIEEILSLWDRNGFAANTISGGSTPTLYQSHLIPSLTEIRPGTYIYNDRNTFLKGWCEIADCAAHILCTVISNAVPEKVVIDAGSKTLTSDGCNDPTLGGYGYVCEYPDAKIVRLSEEHGEVDISECDAAPKIGERIHVIPNHICPCVNLQNTVYLQHEDGTLEEIPVDSRGMLS